MQKKERGSGGSFKHNANSSDGNHYDDSQEDESDGAVIPTKRREEWTAEKKLVTSTSSSSAPSSSSCFDPRTVSCDCLYSGEVPIGSLSPLPLPSPADLLHQGEDEEQADKKESKEDDDNDDEKGFRRHRLHIRHQDKGFDDGEDREGCGGAGKGGSWLKERK